MGTLRRALTDVNFRKRTLILPGCWSVTDAYVDQCRRDIRPACAFSCVKYLIWDKWSWLVCIRVGTQRSRLDMYIPLP